MTFANNGLEAVTLFKYQYFDVVLMDIQMPVMDGFTALKQMRKIEKLQNIQSSLIIAVTAHAEDIEKCFENGFNQVIIKPYTRSTLIKKIIKLFKLKAEKSHSDEEEKILDEIKALRPVFLKNKQKTILEIGSYIENKDYAYIKRFGHTLKGDSRPYGFEVFEKLGFELEKAAGKEVPQPSEIEKIVKKIEKTIESELKKI